MREVPRKRRYVKAWTLLPLRPLLRHRRSRDAYVLRAVGRRIGPVLRVDRRHHNLPITGPDRRRASAV